MGVGVTRLRRNPSRSMVISDTVSAFHSEDCQLCPWRLAFRYSGPKTRFFAP
jgi:hypothetical protein